jgi:hypothetical protein
LACFEGSKFCKTYFHTINQKFLLANCLVDFKYINLPVAANQSLPYLYSA